MARYSQVNQQVTEAIQGSDSYIGGTHLGAFQASFGVPVSSYGMTLQQSHKETDDGVSSDEHNHNVAEELIRASGKESHVG